MDTFCWVSSLTCLYCIGACKLFAHNYSIGGEMKHTFIIYHLYVYSTYFASVKRWNSKHQIGQGTCGSVKWALWNMSIKVSSKNYQAETSLEAAKVQVTVNEVNTWLGSNGRGGRVNSFIFLDRRSVSGRKSRPMWMRRPLQHPGKNTGGNRRTRMLWEVVEVAVAVDTFCSLRSHRAVESRSIRAGYSFCRLPTVTGEREMTLSFCSTLHLVINPQLPAMRHRLASWWSRRLCCNGKRMLCVVTMRRNVPCWGRLNSGKCIVGSLSRINFERLRVFFWGGESMLGSMAIGFLYDYWKIIND